MPQPRLLLTRRWPEPVQAYLRARYDVTCNEPDEPMTADALRAAARSYEVLCPTVSDRLGADIFDQPDCIVRLVCNYGVGYEHIAMDACEARGIIVTNTQDVLTDATAELAILLMLMIARRAGEGERELRSSLWSGWRPTHLLGTQLTGKTLGLVGFGRIAQTVASRAAAAFDMDILYHSRHPAAVPTGHSFHASYRADLDQLLTEADFVSLHCPGGAQTKHLIDARRLARMKPSAFLINTARGSVVDEQALVQALQEGTIAGAALDVFQDEPNVRDDLKHLDNVVLLPHLGSATRETRVAMGMRAVTNFEHWLAGREPPDRVRNQRAVEP